MRTIGLLACLLPVAACAGPGVPAQDALDLDGHVFHRISPALYGKPGPAFYLLETEVTNAMYDAYLQDTSGTKIEERSTKGETPEMKKMRQEGWQSSADNAFEAPNPDLLWKGNRPPPGTEDHPVSLITVHEADAFCRWLTRRWPDRGTFRMPTADEWLVAAYGAGRPSPWGTHPAGSQVHFNSTRPEPVRARPEGRSPEGVYGLWGNVSEFVLQPEDPPQDAHSVLAIRVPKNSLFVGVGARWMGGSYHTSILMPGQDYWGYWHSSEGRSQEIGFRVLLDPEDREHRYRHQTPYDRERR